MIKGIIFDLDGTILNTAADLCNCINLTFQHFGYDSCVDEKMTMALVGHGMRNLMIDCFEDKDGIDIDEALAVFLDYYDKHYFDETRPYEKIDFLISSLVERNYLIGVNSNKNHSYTRRLIEMNFPLINLDYVKGIGLKEKVKPDPANVNLILNRMAISNKEAVYVGDSPTDLKTAFNANIPFVGVSWGFRSREQLLSAGAEIIIDNPLDLLDIIDKI